jgi:hypothetical protein
LFLGQFPILNKTLRLHPWPTYHKEVDARILAQSPLAIAMPLDPANGTTMVVFFFGWLYAGDHPCVLIPM